MSPLQIVVLLFVFLSSTCVDAADRLFVKFVVKQTEARGGEAKDEIISTMQGQATVGEEFYFRTVSLGWETVLSGILTQASREQELIVNFNYHSRRLGSFGKSTKVVKGKETVRMLDEKVIHSEVSDEAPKLQYYLQVHYFAPAIGYIEKDAEWSVQLVDANGRPVPNARTSMYDENWYRIHQIVTSDANGIVRRRVLEEMPRLTFVAESQNPHLIAIVHLNRDQADRPYKVVMRSDVPLPKEIQDKLFE